jgi:hypothetical protein
MNVANVFAADTLGTKSGPEKDTTAKTITTTWTFTSMDTTGNWVKDKDYNGLTVSDDNIFKPKSGFLQFNLGGTLYIPISDNTDGGTISFSIKKTTNNRTLNVADNKDAISDATTTPSYEYSATDVNNNKLGLTPNGTFTVYSITLVENIAGGEDPDTPNATGVSVDVDTNSIYVGDTIKATATVSPEGASQSVVWSSNNEDAATVGTDGTITGISEGTAEITATAKDTELSDKVTITVSEVPVVELTAGENEIKFSRTEKAHLTTDKEYGGAYSSHNDSENYVQLDDKGALLYDNGENTTTLTVPVLISQNASKVTFSGTITTVNEASGNWTLFSVNGANGAIARIRVASDKNIGLQKGSDGSIVETSTAIANETSYNFVLTLDYTSGKSSLQINNGTSIENDFDSTQAVTNISSLTAGGAKRSLRLSDVTLDVEENSTDTVQVVTPISATNDVAFVKAGTRYFGVIAVAADEVANLAKLVINTASGTEVENITSVYSSVKFTDDDTEHNAKEFDSTITDGYVYAFEVIANANETLDEATARAAITSLQLNKTVTE